MADSGANDTVDSWEDLEDSEVLDQKLKELRPKESSKQRVNEGAPLKLRDETIGTQYQPTVKILKRQPNSLPSPSDLAKKEAMKKPVKSLEQREAEYAEARLRILGSAKYDEDPADTAAAPATSVTNVTTEKPPRFLKQMEEMKLTNNVLRQPKGPDGSQGFNQAR